MTSHTDLLDDVLRLAVLVQADSARFERERGLTGPRVHLLWVLGHAGPVTQQALALALEVTPRNVTGLVDGLVASGHVTREPHPRDRRAALVTPTSIGAAVIDELVAAHTELADRLFAGADQQRLEVFGAVLRETAERFSSAARPASAEAAR